MATTGSVFIIGSGTAGTACARSLSSAGWDVTVAERDRVGGTCLWRGCVPKKALYSTARTMREIGAARARGTVEGDMRADWQGALAWKWHAQETYAGDQEALLAARGVALVKSNDTRFVAPDEVESGGRRYKPDHIVIATGSMPVVPRLPGAELADTSEAALRYQVVPSSLLVVGGGFVGVELGTIFASLGSRVTFVTHGPRLLDMLDPDLSTVAEGRLTHLGATIFSETTVTAFEQRDNGISATTRSSAGDLHTDVFERVLVAVGRAPALDGLDLAAGGVDTDARGRLVLDQYLRSSNPRVWACGDAAGGMMQTPVANLEGHAIARSIASGEPGVVDTSTVPTTTFATPQLAQVGLTAEAAERAGITARVSKQPFEYVAAAIIEEKRDGFAKLVFDEASGRLIGGAIASPSASDLIYALEVGLRAGVTQEQLKQTVGIHPAFCEALAWAAG